MGSSPSRDNMVILQDVVYKGPEYYFVYEYGYKKHVIGKLSKVIAGEKNKDNKYIKEDLNDFWIFTKYFGTNKQFLPENVDHNKKNQPYTFYYFRENTIVPAIEHVRKEFRIVDTSKD